MLKSVSVQLGAFLAVCLSQDLFGGNLSSVPAKQKGKSQNDLAARIYRRLKGARGLDDDELWQHALFFAMSPQQRCHFSLQTARSALSLRRSARKA
jgi:hypothetical protein